MRRGIIALAMGLSVAIALHASDRAVPLGLDLYRPVPHDNPQTARKIGLGRRLFRDGRLSRDGSLSCRGCHDPARAFTNGRPTARGINGTLGRRNVPTLVNRAWGSSYFWDGRAATLEQQALGPIFNPGELGGTPDGIIAVARSRDYLPDFLTAFGHDPTVSDVAAALASYVRTIVSGDSPFDRFVSGNTRALSESARRGAVLFRTKARCGTCHAGPLLSDDQFHNTGVAWRTGVLTDEGRFRVSGAPADRGAFKTPTLREIRRTAPYMHDGSFTTLTDVIDFYDRGGISNPALDREIRPLQLSSVEKKDLLNLLFAITGRIQEGR